MEVISSGWEWSRMMRERRPCTCRQQAKVAREAAHLSGQCGPAAGTPWLRLKRSCGSNAMQGQATQLSPLFCREGG